jgi:hypothetical protein
VYSRLLDLSDGPLAYPDNQSKHQRISNQIPSYCSQPIHRPIPSSRLALRFVSQQLFLAGISNIVHPNTSHHAASQQTDEGFSCESHCAAAKNSLAHYI